MVQPHLQNPTKNGKAANTTGTNSQLKENRTKTKSDVNRKGPASKLCVRVWLALKSKRSLGAQPAASPLGYATYAAALGSAPWTGLVVFNFLFPFFPLAVGLYQNITNVKQQKGILCLKQMEAWCSSLLLFVSSTSHLLLPKNPRYHRT